MNVKTFFTIKGVITLIFALLFLLVPVWAWGLYDVKLDMAGAMVARYLGAAFLAIFMICWFNRDASEEAQKSATLNLAITDTIGFALLIPQTRRLIRIWLRAMVSRRIQRGQVQYWEVR